MLQRSFKKIRINNKQFRTEEVHNLMQAKNILQEKICQVMESLELTPVLINSQSDFLICLKENVDEMDKRIADMCAEKNMQIIKDHYETVTDVSGTFNVPKMWGLKKKLNLSSKDVPSAKLDKDGNLITTKNGLLDLYRSTYMDRLTPKEIRPEYLNLKELKENLFELRLQISSQMNSEDWKTEKIEKICKSLKNSKARDECGLVYELFKPPYAGPDVYESLTKLFNLAKKELSIPEFFETMSITSLYKNRGQKSDIGNECGIFNLSKIRSIFDKDIYSDIYEEIDKNMSCSNVGG